MVTAGSLFERLSVKVRSDVMFGWLMMVMLKQTVLIELLKTMFWVVNWKSWPSVGKWHLVCSKYMFRT